MHINFKYLVCIVWLGRHSAFDRASNEMLYTISEAFSTQYGACESLGTQLGRIGGILEVRVLVDLCGAQGVSSVDGGGGRGADVSLVCELGLVLTVVQRGGGQHSMVHGHRDLMDNAGGVCPVLYRVPLDRALRCHEMGHSTGGAQSGRASVCIQVRLAREVSGGQMRVDVGGVGRAVVMEGVGGLRGDGGSDVRLLPPVSSVTLGDHVLLCLA